MSDDQSDPPKPIKLEDLAKLGIRHDMKPLGEVAKTLAGMGPELNMARGLAKQLEAQQKKFKDLLRPSKEIEALRNHLDSLSKPSPAMKSILDQVESQRRLLDSISKSNMGRPLEERLGADINHRIVSVPRMPDIKFPRNPILDTNAKLDGIEQKFETMLDVITNAARIGNDIQAQTTTFVGKFEEASIQTDNSARKAILVGVFALVIATLSPFAPMVVDYFSPNRTVPSIEALTREIISARQSANADSQKLIGAMKDRDEQVTERMVGEVRRKQDETNVILRELLQTLRDLKIPANL